MDLSAVGRAVLIAREGLRLEAYRDSVGIWTIGVGHTAAAGPPLPRAGLRIGAEEADAIFARDVARFVRTVAEAIPEPLPQHAFDALVSLSFNIGPAAFLRSTVLRCLRAGDRDGAIGESADLLFHLIILLADLDISLDEVMDELDRREGVSGIVEKAARPAD